MRSILLGGKTIFLLTCMIAMIREQILDFELCAGNRQNVYYYYFYYLIWYNNLVIIKTNHYYIYSNNSLHNRGGLASMIL